MVSKRSLAAKAKKERIQAQNASYYIKNKDKIRKRQNEQYVPRAKELASPRTTKKREKQREYNKTFSAKKDSKEEEKQAKRAKHAESKKKSRKKKNRTKEQKKDSDKAGSPFHNRMQLSRAHAKLKKALPTTPAKGKQVLRKFLTSEEAMKSPRRSSLIDEGVLTSKKTRERAE